MIKYDNEEYEKQNGSRWIDCICDGCGVTYKKQRSELSKSIRNGTKRLFCKLKCPSRNKLTITKCGHCGKQIAKTKKEIQRTQSGYLFCNRSCATSHRNHLKKGKSKSGTCDCGRQKKCANKVCSTCRLEQIEANYNRPISAVLYGKGANRFNHIRGMARTAYRKSAGKICLICGYDKHVDVAHIKPICEFELTAKISDVNDMSNLLGLCKNHHWELDNGLISITKKE